MSIKFWKYTHIQTDQADRQTFSENDQIVFRKLSMLTLQSDFYSDYFFGFYEFLKFKRTLCPTGILLLCEIEILSSILGSNFEIGGTESLWNLRHTKINLFSR